MTVPVPLDAFDHARPVRARMAMDKGKLTGIALTVLFHVGVVAALLTAVHVSQTRVVQELSVAVLPEKQRPKEDFLPPPKMVAPAAVTVATPEVVIQQSAPSPVTATPPQPRQAEAPPAPPAPPSPVAGEGRDVFLGRLLAQLNQYKRYPRAARQAHIEGVVMLHFVMDASGKVLKAEIAKSSGRPVLDNEVMSLIQRAQPLPALPANFPTRTLDAIVPIEFYLNQ